jgi:hypothetical protein
MNKSQLKAEDGVLLARIQLVFGSLNIVAKVALR